MKNTENILIHVGKCSGTIVSKSMLYHNLLDNKFSIHYANQHKKPSFRPKKFLKKYKLHFRKYNHQFIVCIRHPIDRFISAFYFKYTRIFINKSNKHNSKIETKGFKKFNTIQKLAENLYNEDGSENITATQFCNNSDHLSYGLHHYLGNFSETKLNIKVIRHEFLNDDYKTIFKKDLHVEKIQNEQPNILSKINPGHNDNVDKFWFNKIELSKKAYHNLLKFLKADLEVIQSLSDSNLISDEYRDYCLYNLPDHIIVNESSKNNI